MKREKTLALIAPLVALGLTLTACSDAGSNDAAESATHNAQDVTFATDTSWSVCWCADGGHAVRDRTSFPTEARARGYLGICHAAHLVRADLMRLVHVEQVTP